MFMLCNVCVSQSICCLFLSIEVNKEMNFIPTSEQY